MKSPLEGTIFEEYSTVIFDLDGTIWDCYAPTGEARGAYKTTPPYKRETEAIAVDINKNIIRLQQGVVVLLNQLDAANKNLGIISRSELVDKPFSAQPAVMLLKLFDIYKYFNYQITLKLNGDKAEYLKPEGKTLFIDDEEVNTNAVNLSGKADVLVRKAFGDWSQILQPKQEILSFAIAGGNLWEVEDNSLVQRLRYLMPGTKIKDYTGVEFLVMSISMDEQSIVVRNQQDPTARPFRVPKEELEKGFTVVAP